MNPPHHNTTDRLTTTPSRSGTSRADLVCLSHLRWNFVFQRPQHLMTRFASERRVFFFEEPIFDSERPQLKIRRDGDVRVVVPHLPTHMSASKHAPNAKGQDAIRDLLAQMCLEWRIDRPVCWYYTPMALSFSRVLQPGAVVYDCMDEL